jgi:hypothetical protein
LTSRPHACQAGALSLEPASNPNEFIYLYILYSENILLGTQISSVKQFQLDIIEIKCPLIALSGVHHCSLGTAYILVTLPDIPQILTARYRLLNTSVSTHRREINA